MCAIVQIHTKLSQTEFVGVARRNSAPAVDLVIVLAHIDIKMPQAFVRCVRGGGRVRTISHGKNAYQYVCYRGGRSYAGEVHHKKEKGQDHHKTEHRAGKNRN